jgi:hypothetical protein
MPGTESNYVAECNCGEKLTSSSLEFRCGQCGVEFRAEWPCTLTIQPRAKAATASC